MRFKESLQEGIKLAYNDFLNKDIACCREKIPLYIFFYLIYQTYRY